MNVLRRCLPYVLVLGLLSGCGVVSSVKKMLLPPPHASLRSLTVSADPGANLGNATQLDVVVVFNSNASASLPKTGPDWFRQREALRSALAKDIVVVSLQVPSASPRFQVKLPRKTKKAVAVVAFANYAAPEGWPLITLTPYKKAALRLQVKSIAVSGK